MCYTAFPTSVGYLHCDHATPHHGKRLSGGKPRLQTVKTGTQVKETSTVTLIRLRLFANWEHSKI